jgi:tyrosyl-tRNA synthetase
MPLITRSDGAKFGKTEEGTVWLDAARTSPYAFYQFWLGTADADVYRFLRYFTFIDVQQIDQWESQGERCQKILADEVTRLVHGEEATLAAQRITAVLFGGSQGSEAELTESDLEQLKQDGMPASDLSPEDFEKPLTTILTDAGMAKAGREVKDALGRNAVLINGQAKGVADMMAAAECFARESALFGRFFLVRLGKKKHHLFELV